MQLKFILLLLAVGAAAAEQTTTEFDPYAQPEESEESPCDPDEDFVDGKCIDGCISRNLCGNFTTCATDGSQVTCSCLRGFTGSPIDGCFKMNEASPCDPDPCGPNSECIVEDEINGPHCRCREDFYDWPPSCRAGCKTNFDCPGVNEVCDSKHYCRDLCDPSQCGEHSHCRVDKKRSTAHCSCEAGFIPAKGVGCRAKTSADLDIPIAFIADVVSDPCGKRCGRNAFCDLASGSCVCTQGFAGNASHACEKIQNPDTIDACSPNPCGAYSECKIVDNEMSCSCVDGYGTPPYCYGCHTSEDCGELSLCISGRCVLNVCDEYCGKNANCNVFNDTLECSCSPSAAGATFNKPYEECITVSHIPPAVIATLLG